MFGVHRQRVYNVQWRGTAAADSDSTTLVGNRAIYFSRVEN